ncbi:MAG: TetR/AcrR family transcriptional regulator [Caldisericaceae bacterium]
MKNENNKRERIISVALDLFLENGFARTSVEEIASNASIAKGSFYNYFDSKDKLLEQIVRDTVQDIERDLKTGIEHNTNQVKAIENYLETNIELSKKYTPAILISLREAGIFPVSGRENLASLINLEIRQAIEEFIVSLKGAANEEEVSMLWGVTLALWIDITFNNISPSIEKLANIIWDGLKWKTK